MTDQEDPVAARAKEEIDLYDVATWEERTSLDGLAVALYTLFVYLSRGIVVLTALLILVGIGGLSMVTDPQVGVLTALSAVPALGLAAYVWYSDVTSSEPLTVLVATFLLGVLTANFAAVLNSVAQPAFKALGFAGSILFFFLVVGPVEETVKLLAVRLYAYGTNAFTAVVDGAVYGAMAGLGFAFIENALYIGRQVGATDLELGLGLIGVGGGITAVRALAGPGHVIYSAFAGYYLGLAKFNPGNRGPIVVKGLLIATVIHASYNSLVGIGSGLIQMATGLPSLPAYFVFVLAYDGLFGLLLLRKIKRYQEAYGAVHENEEAEESVLTSESTEFE